ncbi:hypothetical protein STENM223S_03534 [Streptomyces tendae]
MARARNEALAALLREAGWSQPQAAAAVARVAAESGVRELEAISRSHIAMWVQGTQPSGQAPHILRETLSRRLGRHLTLADLGLEGEATGRTDSGSDWSVDPLTVLAELGSDDLDMHRRKLLATAAYSAVGLALPTASWWAAAPAAAAKRPAVSRPVTQADIDDVRGLTTFYSARDQQRGGASGRSALAGHLRDEAVPLLGSRFRTEQLRRDTYSAVAEMTYLAGWMAFDASEHRTAQRYLTLAARIAAEAGDGPLGGHILRALAHQAVDLGHPRRALALADASMSRDRYGQASPPGESPARDRPRASPGGGRRPPCNPRGHQPRRAGPRPSRQQRGAGPRGLLPGSLPRPRDSLRSARPGPTDRRGDPLQAQRRHPTPPAVHPHSQRDPRLPRRRPGRGTPGQSMVESHLDAITATLPRAGEHERAPPSPPEKPPLWRVGWPGTWASTRRPTPTTRSRRSARRLPGTRHYEPWP